MILFPANDDKDAQRLRQLYDVIEQQAKKFGIELPSVVVPIEVGVDQCFNSVDQLRKIIPPVSPLIRRGHWKGVRAALLLWFVYWTCRPASMVDIRGALKSVTEER